VIDTIDLVGIVSHAVFTPNGKRACGLMSRRRAAPKVTTRTGSARIAAGGLIRHW